MRRAARPGWCSIPATPLDYLDFACSTSFDIVLIMSVNPVSVARKASSRSALEKDPPRYARRKCIDRSGRDIRLEVDGGVKADNIGAIAAAGADTFVAGSAIFGAKDYASEISAMRGAMAAAGAKEKP